MEVIEEGHICVLWLRVSELLTDAGPKLNCTDALDFLMEIFSQINFSPRSSNVLFHNHGLTVSSAMP
jgi:hypothetical protein